MADEQKNESIEEQVTQEAMSETPQAQTQPTDVSADGPKMSEEEMEAAEKRDGMLDQAGSLDGGVPPADDEPDALPSFFVEPEDRHKVEVSVLYDRKTGRVRSVARPSIIDVVDPDEHPHLKRAECWFEFSLPAYEDMALYRRQSSTYQPSAGRMIVDAVRLRNFLIVWHLKDWNITDRKGEAVDLSFTDEGGLTDESARRVYKTPSMLIDVVMTIFQRDVLE